MPAPLQQIAAEMQDVPPQQIAGEMPSAGGPAGLPSPEFASALLRSARPRLWDALCWNDTSIFTKRMEEQAR
jgi:hypothetical protein